jgi:outer membrane protein OmpA-like peptidoglycan-associated protein
VASEYFASGAGSGQHLRSIRIVGLTLLGVSLAASQPRAQTAPATDCRQTLAQTVEFASDKTTLDGTARALVRRQAKCLESGGGPVSVEGYWDDSATQPKARELSLRIASRVRDELVKNGVADTRVKAVGHGRDKSLDPDRPTERRRAVRLVVAGG